MVLMVGHSILLAYICYCETDINNSTTQNCVQSHRRRYQCCADTISLAGVSLAGGSELILDFQERFVLGLRNDEENVYHR